MDKIPFSIEFQPIGIRLVCSEPLTLLDAARQAGIQLQSTCGGKGTCGRCALIILEGDGGPVTRNEEIFRKGGILKPDERLACETIVQSDTKVFIPSSSFEKAQILQTEGNLKQIVINSPIHIETLHLKQPDLAHPLSDHHNIIETHSQLNFENDDSALRVLRSAATIIRTGNWEAFAVCNHDYITHIVKERPKLKLGAAVDIGSTKIACYLLDLTNGNTLTVKGVPNPQIAYGEDIMARLGFAMQSDSSQKHLHDLTMDAINQAINTLCHELGIASETIMDFCLVGNTAMHHFLLDLPSRSLATSPFTPVIDQELYVSTTEIGIEGMPGSKAFIPGPIAGFVGSDHLAFLLSEEFGKTGAVKLGIDIGTNTEIALQKGKRIVSCSTASGPAFEGAHIRFGMRAAPGAIEHVHITRDGTVKCDVIGETQASGICGSGILDAISEMKQSGILNTRGRLDLNHPRVCFGEYNVRYFPLIAADKDQREISISQKDIDQILLAKGAIRSGISILMDHLQVKPEDIEEIIIAGAFGSYLNPYHAIQIGMLPEVDLSRIRAVGNAAGAGAKMMLVSETARSEASELAHRIEHLELNTYPDFDMFFVDGIRFHG
ncbi:MAG: DUF4445 domain-containing protein [Chloroflexi bacterium]|nr:DUF4445 domain-containing protein [Chloroflexota bacterium]